MRQWQAVPPSSGAGWKPYLEAGGVGGLQVAHGVRECKEGVDRVHRRGHLLVLCPLRVIVALIMIARLHMQRTHEADVELEQLCTVQLDQRCCPSVKRQVAAAVGVPEAARGPSQAEQHSSDMRRRGTLMRSRMRARRSMYASPPPSASSSSSARPPLAPCCSASSICTAGLDRIGVDCIASLVADRHLASD